MNLTNEEVLELLPQRKPFKFIDKIHCIDEQHTVCSYTFKEDEYFYEGHYHNNPITPGVILVETAAQMSLVSHGIWHFAKECTKIEEMKKYLVYFTDIEKVEFTKVVLPGEIVNVEAKILSWKRRRIRHEVVMKNSKDEVVMTCILGGLGIRKEQ